MHTGPTLPRETLEDLMGPRRTRPGRMGLSSLIRMMRTAATWSRPKGYTTPKRGTVTVVDRVVEIPVPRRIARRMRSHR